MLIHQFTIEGVAARNIALELWLPTQQAQAPGARPRVLAKMFSGQLASLSGIGSRLSRADQILASNLLNQRQPAINRVMNELAGTIMPRGRLGRLPFRVHRLTVFEPVGTPALSPSPSAAVILYPMVGGLETTRLWLPAGGRELQLLLESPEWETVCQALQAANWPKQPNGQLPWIWDEHLSTANVHLLTKIAISQARPLLATRWRASASKFWGIRQPNLPPPSTPTGMPMSDAYVDECERLGPELRIFIARLIGALA